MRCELVSGISNVGDQDSYEDLMRMEDKEIKFWLKLINFLTIWNKMNGKLLLLITTSVYV
jgi:hypothetical protein